MATKSFFRGWVKALRSGKFKQAKFALYDKDEKAYCCLGVACLLRAREEKKKTGKQAGLRKYQMSVKDASEGEGCQTPKADIEYAGTWLLPFNDQTILSRMNDDGKPFWLIADYIESKYL